MVSESDRMVESIHPVKALGYILKWLSPQLACGVISFLTADLSVLYIPLPMA